MADYPEYELQKNTLTSIVKNSDNLGFQLPQDSVVILTDASTKRFRRGGAPDSYGSDQRDILVVSKNGSIDMKAPLNWDYEQVSSVRITGHRKSQEISLSFQQKQEIFPANIDTTSKICYTINILFPYVIKF